MNRNDQLLLGSIWNKKKTQQCCPFGVGAGGVIPYVSNDFSADKITVNDPNLSGKTYLIFFNDLNRFIYNEASNKEWDYVSGGGFKILIPGFDASANDYHLYVFLK